MKADIDSTQLDQDILPPKELQWKAKCVCIFKIFKNNDDDVNNIYNLTIQLLFNNVLYITTTICLSFFFCFTQSGHLSTLKFVFNIGIHFYNLVESFKKLNQS